MDEDGEWLLLSQAIDRTWVIDHANRRVIEDESEIGKRRQALVEELAAGRYLVRWIEDGRQQVGKLPEHMWRHGRPDWTWSALTRAGRTLQRIEVLFPSEDDQAASEPTIDPYRTGVSGPATAKPDREPGRPLTTGKDAEVVIREILVEGRWTKSTYKLVKEIKARGVKAGDSTIRRAIARVRAGD